MPTAGQQPGTPETRRGQESPAASPVEDSRTERRELRQQLENKAREELPSVLSMEGDDFMEMLEEDRDIDNERNPAEAAWNEPQIYRNMDRHSVNPDTWDNDAVSSLPGLLKVYRDVENLGILDSGPDSAKSRNFYESMFYILRTGADPEKNPYKREADKRNWFSRPFSNMQKLRDLEASGEFVGGKKYVAALQHLNELKALLHNYREHEINLAERKRLLESGGGMGEVMSGIEDAFSSNMERFSQSLRDRDWMTAGMYVAGAAALYMFSRKVYRKVSGDKGSKLLFWGALTAGAGYLFAREGGYDPIEKYWGGEQEGTPFEYMQDIIQSNPHLRERTENLDYGIMLRMEEVPLSVLHEEFLASRGGDTVDGVRRTHGFIPPERFSRIFRDELEGVGYVDPDRSDKRLNAKERRYLEIGRQLYSMAYAFRGVYDETLKEEHPRYEGVSYEDAIRADWGVRTPRELTLAVIRYSELDSKRRTTEAIERAQRDLREILSDAGDEFRRLVVDEMRVDGSFEGNIMGVPVVVGVEEGRYTVRVGNENVRVNEGDEEISFERDDRTVISEFTDWMKQQAIGLILDLWDRTGLGGENWEITDDGLEFDNGRWRATAERGGEERDVIITFGNNVMEVEAEDEESPDEDDARSGTSSGDAGTGTSETGQRGTTEQESGSAEPEPPAPEEPEPEPEPSGDALEMDEAKELLDEVGDDDETTLTVEGYTSLDAGAAEELAKFEGEELILNDLTTLSVADARALTSGNFSGTIRLEGLNSDNTDEYSLAILIDWALDDNSRQIHFPESAANLIGDLTSNIEREREISFEEGRERNDFETWIREEEGVLQLPWTKNISEEEAEIIKNHFSGNTIRLRRDFDDSDSLPILRSWMENDSDERKIELNLP